MPLMEINWKPDTPQLRKFGFYTGAFLAALGALVFWRERLLFWEFGESAARTVGLSLWGVGAAMVILAMVRAGLLKPLYLLLNAAAMPIGYVVSHVILFIIYYLIFTPIALVFRLIGRDALHRDIDRQAGTYWSPLDPHPEPRRYFRQF